MIVPHALRVLGALGEVNAAAVGAPTDKAAMVEARRAAYAAVPRALRPVVRTRVTRAVSESIFSTQHGDDEPHVHRLAYLHLLRTESVAPDDVEATERVFREARTKAKDRERPSTVRTLAIGALMLALPTALLGWWLWPSDPFAQLRDAPTATRGAYLEGGRPDPGTAEARAVFEVAMPAFVVALDRERARRESGDGGGRSVDLSRAADAVVHASGAALGAEITSFLQAVVEQSVSIVESAQDDRGVAAESHARSIDALNAALQAEGLGYYVDADVAVDVRSGARRVYLSTFIVDNVHVWASGETRVRALRLRRLDSLNFAHSVLGFTRPHIRDALALDEPIEEHLVESLVPALVDGAPLRLMGDSDAWARTRFEPIAALAGAAVRGEARVLLAGDGNAGAELGALLTRREALFQTLDSRLSRAGLGVRAPSGYAFDPERYAPLRQRFYPAEWRELRTLADALAETRHLRTFRVLRARLRQSVERHEVQHRLDFLSGTVAEAPESLARYTGPVHVGERESPGAARASAELSAYLSEIARDAELSKTNLALLSRHLFERRRWGTAESYAALVITAELAQELSLVFDDLLRSHAIDRDEVARVLGLLLERPGPELAAAAQRAWSRLYRRPFPELVRGGAGADVWDEMDGEMD